MDGYSVNEAAAVLGIPEGRVWELLARGVLSGSTEVGGDMRVFLRETAVAEAPKRDGNGHANGGNGGNGEITPFRELLTEFRNLTERYGQALLALGESRGEVASLRGRVDLLEARLDHRLPWSEAPTAWSPAPEPSAETPTDEADAVSVSEVSSVSNLTPAERPAAPDPDPEPVPEAPLAESSADEGDHEHEDEDFVADILGATLGSPSESTSGGPPAPDSPAPDSTPTEESEPPPKPRPAHRASSREALAGFAEALARAQDPATADVAADIDDGLPGSQETADAVAAYRRETGTDRETETEPAAEADASETLPVPPQELVAELEPTPEAEVTPEPPAASIVRPGYNTDTPEPDWIAEEDLIISAGEDASVRADERAHQVATAAEPEVVEPTVAEPEDAWPEVPKAQRATAETRPAEAVPGPVDADAENLAASSPPEVFEREAVEAKPQVVAVAAPDMTAETPALEAAAETPHIADEPEPEHELPAAESLTAPVEIAAEPPATDDVALLVGPEPFSEPPIVPREPAFWESGSGRAPFAIAQPDPWEASPVQTMPIDVASPVPAIAPQALREAATPPPAQAPVVSAESASAPVAPAPAPKAPAPAPTESEAAPSPPALSPAAQAGRAAAARRRPPPRGPAARAIRRLRLMLD